MPSAVEALEEILHHAADSAELAQALRDVEQQLGADPFAVGESRGHESERIAFAGNVSLLFYIKANEPVVVVYGVWATD
jgi:hypothetical protein